MPRRIPWRFRDPQSGETYHLPVNPLTDGGSHGVSKQTKYESAISTYRSVSNYDRADDMVIQDSPNEVERFSYSGTLYTKDEYDKFAYWFQKTHPWELRDDLGREFLVYPEAFTPSRQRSAKFRWKHTYDITGLVLRELGI